MKTNHSYKLLNKAKDKKERRDHSKEENEFYFAMGIWPNEEQLKERQRWLKAQKTDLHSPMGSIDKKV